MGQAGHAQTRKIITGLSTIGIILFAALAYNFGSLNQGIKEQQVIEAAHRAYKMTQERLMMCKQKKSSIKMNNVDDLVEANLKDMLLVDQERKSILEALEQGKEAAEECERQYEVELEERGRNPSVMEVVSGLEFDIEQLEVALTSANDTKNQHRASLQQKVRALRLENFQIRNLEGASRPDTRRQQQEVSTGGTRFYEEEEVNEVEEQVQRGRRHGEN